MRCGALFRDMGKYRGFQEELHDNGFNCFHFQDANSALRSFVREGYDLLVVNPYAGLGDGIIDKGLERAWPEINVPDVDMFSLNLGRYLASRIRAQGSVNWRAPLVMIHSPQVIERRVFREQLEQAGVTRFFDELETDLPRIVGACVEMAKKSSLY